jgi:hypothetical protein
MRKHISFAIAVAMLGLALGFWVKTNAEVVRPKLDFASPISNPYLPVQVLEPVY